MSQMNGFLLLDAVADLWERYTILVFYLKNAFAHLERFYVKYTLDNSPLLSDAVKLFQAMVYDGISGNLLTATIDGISSERNGCTVNRATLRRITKIFCVIGSPNPRIIKQSSQDPTYSAWQWFVGSKKGVYVRDFEPKFLSKSEEFYASKAEESINKMICAAYLHLVDRSLIEEKERAQAYLDSHTQGALLNLVHQKLIRSVAERIVQMEQGLGHWLSNQMHSELSLIFRLFVIDPESLQWMTKKLKFHIQDQFAKLLQGETSRYEPETFIDAVLSLKAQIDASISSNFGDEKSFVSAKDEVMQAVLNAYPIFAEALATYCDVRLKKACNKHALEELSMNVVELIKNVAAAHWNLFVEVYSSKLSLRLLSSSPNRQNDYASEEHLLSKIKGQMGDGFLRKLEGMVREKQISDDIRQESQMSINGVQFQVSVLQGCIWPDKPDTGNDNVIPPEVLVSCCEAFNEFYTRKFVHRKVVWWWNRGECVIECTAQPYRPTLTVSTYQAIILMLFNRHEALRLDEILAQTRIFPVECVRHLETLAIYQSNTQQSILIRSSEEVTLDTVFTVNEKYKLSPNDSHQTVKAPDMRVSPVQPAATHVLDEAEIKQNRGFILKACIARTMKAKLSLEHSQLLEEVTQRCRTFTPGHAEIEEAIQDMIKKEIIQEMTTADNVKVYNYMP